MYSREEIEVALAVYAEVGSTRKAVAILGYPGTTRLAEWARGKIPRHASGAVVPSLRTEGEDRPPEGRRRDMELPDELPDDPAELREIIRRQRAENEALAMERDLMREVVAVVKKDPAADPAALTSREKAEVIEALRGTYSVTSLASRLGIASSTYYYRRAAMRRPARREGRLAAAAPSVRRAFESGRGAYGYRRV